MPRVNSEIRGNKVDHLRRKGKDLIPNKTFSTMRMTQHQTFPSKDESTNGGRGHQTTRNQKKSRHNGLDRGTPSGLMRMRLMPPLRHFFDHVMEIWINAAASCQKRHSVPGPLHGNEQIFSLSKDFKRIPLFAKILLSYALPTRAPAMSRGARSGTKRLSPVRSY